MSTKIVWICRDDRSDDYVAMSEHKPFWRDDEWCWNTEENFDFIDIADFKKRYFFEPETNSCKQFTISVVEVEKVEVETDI